MVYNSQWYIYVCVFIVYSETIKAAAAACVICSVIVRTHAITSLRIIYAVGRAKLFLMSFSLLARAHLLKGVFFPRPHYIYIYVYVLCTLHPEQKSSRKHHPKYNIIKHPATRNARSTHFIRIKSYYYIRRLLRVYYYIV